MSAPPGSGSGRRTRHLSTHHRHGSRLVARIPEGDADDEDAEQLGMEISPLHRQTRSNLSESGHIPKSHRRTRSFTHANLSTRDSMFDSPAGRKARLRRSLAGPVVQEMTVETRARIVIEVAQDCIVKLLRAGLDGHMYREGGEHPWEASYEALQGKLIFSILCGDLS